MMLPLPRYADKTAPVQRCLTAADLVRLKQGLTTFARVISAATGRTPYWVRWGDG